MAIISDVLRGPYGDIQPNVIITMQAKGTTARVLTSNRSSTVTDAAGKYSMTVFPGEYEVTISTLGHVGDIRVLTDSVNGTLNDFLISPPKPDELTPEVVRTVDTMRAETATSAAAAKTSENNAAATLANAVKKGEFGIGGVTPAMPLVDTLSAVKSQMSGKYIAWAGSEGMPRTDTAYMLDWTLASASSGVAQGVVFATALITAPSSFDQVYRNVCRNGVFQGWKVMWDENSLSNAMRVGDYGFGSNSPVKLDATTINDAGVNRFISIPQNTTDSPSSAAHAGVMGGYDSGSRWQMTFGQGTLTASISARVRNAVTSSWGPWATLWHTANTTVDANGFIKKASPIVKLFGTGESELNNESQGITSERISEGVYRVSGVLGFNADGAWGGAGNGIEIPVDDNKRPLIWVESKVLPDGDIEIRTYHRTYDTGPYSTRNIEAMDSGEVDKKKRPIFVEMPDGTPIDIPEGRFIDLRVEMPASDEPEPEFESEPEPQVEQEAEPKNGEALAQGESEGNPGPSQEAKE
ncbi:prophage tail fiber N-terminal domain-containing protein [Serratia fonticola]|uniref:phage tail fiber protein n=1 Tax=Serratia fonticola TaxID=47917 RepID=UPI0015C646AD|nr:prophage tail fiber N-terminal domain-containing protein [Serratia fonticola]NYA45716.1 prophage tail fiber N-terminal domain-containing protein [Serratia fonticola]